MEKDDIYTIISNLATIKDEIRNYNLMNNSISESFEEIENIIIDYYNNKVRAIK